jgi:hypothetical protein
MSRYEERIFDVTGHSDPLDLSKSESYIAELNTIIKEKCDFINITLETKGNTHENSKGFISYASPEDYMHNYLLCLNIKGFCVSSIEIILEGDHIFIDSATASIFENHGYNSFLRAILVKICFEQGIRYIKSLAKNELSAILQRKLGAESSQTGKYPITTLDVLKPENIELANVKIASMITTMDDARFCYNVDEDSIKIPNSADEGHFYINDFYDPSGGNKRNKSRRNKSRRNKSRRNKSRRNKNRRNKSRRNKSRRK